jgi:hypothetical protein
MDNEEMITPFVPPLKQMYNSATHKKPRRPAIYLFNRQQSSVGIFPYLILNFLFLDVIPLPAFGSSLRSLLPGTDTGSERCLSSDTAFVVKATSTADSS